MPEVGERSRSLGFLEVSWEFWIGVDGVTPTCSARSPRDASATCLHCGWQLCCPAGGLDRRTHRQHVSASLFGNLRPPSQREEKLWERGARETETETEGFSGVCHVLLSQTNKTIKGKRPETPTEGIFLGPLLWPRKPWWRLAIIMARFIL